MRFFALVILGAVLFVSIVLFLLRRWQRRTSALERAGDALRESEARFRSTLDHLIEGCQIIDRDWRYVYINTAAASHGGRRVEDLSGRTMTESYPGIDQTEVFGIFRRCMETRMPAEIENEFVGLDGTARWFQLVVQPIPEGIFVLSLDITARKHAEAALRRDQSQLAAVIENLQEGVIISDLGGNLLHWNGAAAAMFGLSDREEGRHGLRDLAMVFQLTSVDGTPIPAAELPLARVLRGESFQDLELRVRRAGTEWERIFAYTGSPVHADGETLAFVAIRDITEHRKLEMQFLQAQKLEAVGQLAGGIAHDFNNMLLVIFQRCELLFRALPPDDRSRRHVNEILTAAKQNAALTQQLLAIARRQIMQPKVVEVAPLIRELVPLLERTIGEHVIVRTLVDDDAWRVFTDPSKVRQVLMNLVINARDAMPGGGTLTIEVRNFVADLGYVQLHPQIAHGEYVTLTVSDTGTGIPHEIRDRIFDPFFTTKTVGKGSGLGLAVVRGIVEQTGGHMTVYSEAGQGTMFKLFFPRFEGDVEQLLAAAAGPMPRGSETILLVEDEALVREVLRESLQEQGYSVIEAAGGTAALAAAGRHEGTIDLLITDVMMPGMTGPALAAQLREKHPRLRVICMSGYTDSTVTDHARLESEFVFLEKPIMIDTFLQRTREVLDQRS